MYCIACGQVNPDDAKFCVKCGAAVKRRMEPAPASGRGTSATDASVAADENRRFAPPRSNLDGAVGGASEEEEWQAVVGPKNAGYYLPKFAAAAAGQHFRWHWPAFFVTGYWLLYRKMWLWALLYLFVLPVLVSVVLGILGALAGPHANALGWLPLVWTLLVLIGPPLVANQLYFGHCRSLIARSRARFPTDRSRQLAYLDAKGGTSAIAIIVILVLAIAVVGILVAIALPAYQDYTRRAKISEAVVGATAVAREVGEFYEANGSLPADFDAIRQRANPSKYLASIELKRANGVIEFRAQPDDHLTVPFTLTPAMGADKHVAWKCSVSDAAMRKYAPAACRN